MDISRQTPADFFGESFYSLFSREGVDPLLPDNSNLISYLSCLMAGRIRSDSVFRLSGADTLAERVSTDPDLKESAEFAFFMSSAFPEFLSRRGNAALYDQLGSRLYELLGKHPRYPAEGVNYRKMSKGFTFYRRMANFIFRGILYEAEKDVLVVSRTFGAN